MATEDGGWENAASAYRDVINDPTGDSAYLRDNGLKPNILELLGDSPANHVLDVGCGDGWLFDTIKPANGIECDLVESVRRPRQWPFSLEDVSELSFEDGVFDLIVTSLVLIWVEDLARACTELYRVAADDAVLVISIMHPAFYRMGRVQESGDVLIQENYNDRRVISDLRIANKVGPFRYYHRPLSDYVNALVNAGWPLEELREWAMDADDYRQRFPELRPDDRQRTGRLPLYAFIKCKKIPR